MIRKAKNGKFYRSEDVQEREEYRALTRRIRGASLGVQHLAIANHMRNWRIFYSAHDVYNEERLSAVWGFAPNDFELLPSCD